MIKKIATLSALLLTIGCGSNVEASCENYVASWGSCIDEAYAGDEATLDLTKAALDGTCAGYDGVSGSAAKDAATLLDCYADAIDGGDCSTPDAYITTLSAITSCI